MKYLFFVFLLVGAQAVVAQSILKHKDDKDLSVMLQEVVITDTSTKHYLKDASSSFYGSDAIAEIANIITKCSWEKMSKKSVLWSC